MDAQSDLDLFKEKAAAVQVLISEISDLPAAFDYAADLTAKQGGQVMSAFGWEGQDRAALEEACRRAGVSLVADNLREHAATLHTALTLADWGIADTGSLVLDSSSEDLRLATMLAETHVAVLPISRLQPNAFALEDELNRLMASPPRFLAFITGASRTADIERVLTIGVHGPQELHVLLLKDTES
jgi:L-lactate dehydrogenase complex protein LldG